MANLPAPTPRTFTSSEVEVAAYFNAIRDALLFLLNPPMAVLTQTTVQTFVSGTPAVVSFDTTQSDTYGGHSNSTNNSRYASQVSGWYWCQGTIQFSNVSGLDRTLSFLVNGSAINYFGNALPSASNNVFPTVSCGGLIYLAAGSYVEVQGFQESGGNIATHTLGSSMTVDWRHA